MQIKPRSWNSIVERFSGIDHARPIHRLAEAIAASPYAGQLYPVGSMWDILIYNDPLAEWGENCLRIAFDFQTAMFSFEYVENPYIRKKRWKKECSAEESFSAFIHFLTLKRWFPVARIPRGSWSCDAVAP